MVPLAKTAGLAVVVASLSSALRQCGHKVRAEMPFYAAVDPAKAGATVELVTEVCMRYLGDCKLWGAMMANGMATDFSWGRSAAEYVSIYRRANPAAR